MSLRHGSLASRTLLPYPPGKTRIKTSQGATQSFSTRNGNWDQKLTIVLLKLRTSAVMPLIGTTLRVLEINNSIPTIHQHRFLLFLFKVLHEGIHVFVRVDKAKPLFQPPYEGPCDIIARPSDNNRKEESVNQSRPIPAHFKASAPALNPNRWPARLQLLHQKKITFALTTSQFRPLDGRRK